MRSIIFVILIALTLPLVACGKRGALEPPAGVPDTYHHLKYPNPNE